jgi:hypothetical protein
MKLRIESQSKNRGSRTVLVADGRLDGLVRTEEPSLRARIAARWATRRLDQALAAGIPPEADAALALRAEELTDLNRRRSIAGALREVLREAREGAPIEPARIRPDRRRVAAAKAELSELADTLEDPGPVAAHGVAQAWILLTDGTGPLYNPYTRTSLRTGAARAIRELRPWPV